MSRVTLLLALAAPFAVTSGARAQEASPPAPLLELSLGAAGRLEALVLPGPELVVRPQERDAALVVRRLSVRRHGSAHRYAFEVYGLEAGRYDLGQALVRAADGAAAADLPPLPILIVDPLPAGQVEPHALEATPLPRLGGYRLLLSAGAAVWVAGLAALLFAGRRRGEQAADAAAAPPATLADRLRPLVEGALGAGLEPRQQAHLERLLLAAWRRRLALDALPAAEALTRLRADPQAGALLRALEVWLHAPPGRAQTPDLAALLAPYRDLPADALDGPDGEPAP